MSTPVPENAKIALLTSLITAVTTIIVAFVGIVPQLRQKDTKEVERLQNITRKLEERVEELVSSRGGLSISGTVRNGDNTPKSDAVLFAVKADDTASLDDSGNFLFQNMVRTPYWIVMSDQRKQVRRFLIRPDDRPPIGTAQGVTIAYSYRKE